MPNFNSCTTVYDARVQMNANFSNKGFGVSCSQEYILNKYENMSMHPSIPVNIMDAIRYDYDCLYNTGMMNLG